MNDVVLFDLDSTLANTQHREHILGGQSHESWIEYSKACVGDTVIEGTAAALREFYRSGYEIHLVSGRNDEARSETILWLVLNNVPFHVLRLRTADDIRNNALYKVAYIESIRAAGLNPILFFEDQLAVSKIIQEAGVPVVTVRPWYEDRVGVATSNNFTTGI